MSAPETAAPDAAWSSFDEARQAIDIMPLRDLEALSGEKAPSLLPLSGWALGAGVLIYFFLGTRSPAGQILGFLVGGYGLLAITANRNRAGVYREACYRRWVQRRADEMVEALEAEADDGANGRA